ncbi:hypothetical protein HYU17_04160 [Candidatus Woesearchaeota archaeon]|nr:hypothetical protein [Candidatus Woesearchaeota archaeon]
MVQPDAIAPAKTPAGLATLIRPRFNIPPLEQLAISKDGTPFFTQTTNRLQMQNQLTLYAMLQEAVEQGLAKLPERGPVVDAGCGRGAFFALHEHLPGLDRRKPIIGIDKDKESVETARAVIAALDDSYFRRTKAHLRHKVLDPLDLTKMNPMNVFMHGEGHPGLKDITMVWFNSAFHWIRDPLLKWQVASMFHGMLQENGVFCVSLSSMGTAEQFLRAYNTVVKGLGTFSASNIKGYNPYVFKEDPVGSMNSHYIEKLIESAGFRPVALVELPESVPYNNPLLYSAAVMAYGFGDFTASLDKRGWTVPELKQGLWKDIEAEFVNELITAGEWGKDWEKHGRQYSYHQHNIYSVFVKVPIHATISVPKGAGEKRGNTGDEKKPKPLPALDELLDEAFVVKFGNATVERLAQSHRKVHNRNLEFSLAGDPNELIPYKTEVNVRAIIGALINYAAGAWDNRELKPEARIAYQVENDALKLTMKVRTLETTQLEEHFGMGLRKQVKDNDVKITLYDDRALQTKTYEILVPLKRNAAS